MHAEFRFHYHKIDVWLIPQHVPYNSTILLFLLGSIVFFTSGYVIYNYLNHNLLVEYLQLDILCFNHTETQLHYNQNR